MGTTVQPACKEIFASEHLSAANPIPDGIARVFRDFKLHRSAGLALDDRDTIAHSVSDNEINDLQPDQITGSQLAVYRQVEQRQIAHIASEFEPGADCPDLL